MKKILRQQALCKWRCPSSKLSFKLNKLSWSIQLLSNNLIVFALWHECMSNCYYHKCRIWYKIYYQIIGTSVWKTVEISQFNKKVPPLSFFVYFLLVTLIITNCGKRMHLSFGISKTLGYIFLSQFQRSLTQTAKRQFLLNPLHKE